MALTTAWPCLPYAAQFSSQNSSTVDTSGKERRGRSDDGVNATGQKSPNHSKTIRPLNILQWNAEGVFNKKVPLTERLHKDVDVACIQETHLNTNHRFSIRGYQTFRLDREGRHKGGVLILVRNNIAASDFKVDTNQQAEIHGVKITVDNSDINIFNLYCPPPPPPPRQRPLPSTYTCAITKLPGCW